MTKKVTALLVAVLLIFAVAGSASGLAIGASYGLNLTGGTVGGGVLLSAQFDSLPFLLGLGFSGGGGSFNIGVTADWILYRAPLAGALGLYAGPGLYVDLGNNLFDIGARIPVAIYIFPIDIIELFLEVAPTIGIGFGGGTVRFPEFALQGAFGFRFWF